MNEIEIRRKTNADPWTDFDRVLDQLHSRALAGWGNGWFPEFFASWEPVELTPSNLRTALTDISDTGKSYKISAEIPGIPKDQFKIHVRGNHVEIRAEHETKTDEKSKEFVRKERAYQGYYRAFELPEPVVANEAKAKLENGILELELPKQTPTPEPEEVQVKVQ